MSKIFGRLLVAATLAIALSGTVALRCSAQPGASLQGARMASDGGGLVQKVHGFHCRKELGWDPRAGVYRYHRHEGICKDPQRCLREQYRCNLVMGRGWDSWSYERWGWDNWRFTSCMIKSGCY